MRESAQMTFTLKKSAAGWLIHAWAWTGPRAQKVTAPAKEARRARHSILGETAADWLIRRSAAVAKTPVPPSPGLKPARQGLRGRVGVRILPRTVPASSVSSHS